MATFVTATCSECFMPQQVELNPRRSEVTCFSCRHSVPMFERRDMDAIRATLSTERRKMYIALAFFVGAVFLFGGYVFMNSGDDLVVVANFEGHVVEREADKISIRDPDTGVQRTLLFEKELEPEIEGIRTEHPEFPAALAVKRAGDTNVDVKPIELESWVIVLVFLAGLAGICAIAFSAVATQDRLICEF